MNTSYHKPNLNAPRNRTTLVDFVAYPDKDRFGFFAAMKKQHPNLAKYSNKEIASWIVMHNEAMAAEVVSNGWNGVELPQNLGVVIVSSCRVPEETAQRNIDFKTSNRVGKAIPYGNIHSNGYVAKINYYNNIPWRRFKNRQLWNFKPCRKLQRAVSAEFKKGNSHRYKQFTQWCSISDTFSKRVLRKPARSEAI